MRKLMMFAVVAASLAIAAIAMPTNAEARFGPLPDVPEAAAAQPVQYYYYGYRPRYYAPRYYAPRYYAPRYYAPRYYAPRYYAPRRYYY
jgi:hypothetical protein